MKGIYPEERAKTVRIETAAEDVSPPYQNCMNTERERARGGGERGV